MNRTFTRAFSKFAAKTTPIAGRRKRSPMLEIMENRQLLTGGATGYLSGTAFLDNNGNGQYTAGDTPLANVTVQLYQGTSTNSTPIQTTQTNANGYYEFDNLTPGSYVVQEVAPTGYVSSAAQANSAVNPASVVSSSTIQATVVDPNSVYETYNGIESGLYAYGEVSIDGGAPQVNSFGPMSANLGSTSGGSDLNGGQSFNTFCVNDQQAISFSGPASFQVTPTPVSQLTSNSSVGGEIAYLYNHFGNSSLTNVTGPALQLAIWELLYDGNESSPNFTSGNFQLDGPMTTSGGATESQILAQATTFYNDALGQSESAVFLQTTNPTAANEQSMLAPGALNFGNVAQPQQATAEINGQVFSETTQGTNQQPIAGVTITLENSSGTAVATQTTDFERLLRIRQPRGRDILDRGKPGARLYPRRPAGRHHRRHDYQRDDHHDVDQQRRQQRERFLRNPKPHQRRGDLRSGLLRNHARNQPAAAFRCHDHVRERQRLARRLDDDRLERLLRVRQPHGRHLHGR